MLKIDDIHVYYGAIHAIKGVSFEVGEGEIVALIGANGAGKSTILKTVSGLMHPRSGSISFCGENIAHTDAYKLLRTGLAHVPEGRQIFLQMTVQENLEMGAYINKEVSQSDLEMVFNYFPRLKERRKQIAGKTITGFQTHTTPVLLAHGERAELATEEFLPVTPILEGFVILRKNPNYDL